MASPKYEYIDQELRNSRRILEKSMEFSKRYGNTENASDCRVTDLLERLRNEEFLKNSYEKILKETLVLLKEEQRKSFEYECRIGHLEGILDAGNSEKMIRLEQRLDELERNTVSHAQRQKNLNLASKRRCNSTLDHGQGYEKFLSESQRIKDLEYKALMLETAIKKEKLKKSKTEKTLITTSALKSRAAKVPLKDLKRIKK